MFSVHLGRANVHILNIKKRHKAICCRSILRVPDKRVKTTLGT